MSHLSPDDRRTVDAMFEQALELEGAERVALLDRACAERPAIGEAVQELLRLSSAPESGAGAEILPALVKEPMWRELASELVFAATPTPEVGRWRLVQEIGSGGMGTVYRAVRADGEFDQQAALKLLRPALAGEEVLERFERERQILATLDHPGIARLLDGGRTAWGQPYLVMELVDGQPIDRHCDERRLPIDARLRVFLQVCRAVEHAHARLVVHRDLKPGNILVTSAAQVKLLDFGIAKLLAPEGLGGSDPLTRTVARLLTPEYASPEQVLGRPIGVASDVYQLGVLLYRLLAGIPPYAVTADTPSEIERIICHVDPPRVSQGFDRQQPPDQRVDVVAIAAARGGAPKVLARQLRGDLDTIVAKALRKEPERRYASVAALVDDLERHLDGRPVAARGDTLTYRLGRLVARHRGLVVSAVLLLALLVSYAITVTVQARALARERDRAQAEAAKAQQVKALVLRLFEGADPREAQGQELSARELLDRGWASIEGELAGQPDLQAELLSTVGEIYRELGLYDRAGQLLASALDTARTLSSDQAALQAEVLRAAGRLHLSRGEHDTADERLRDALQLYRQQPGDMRREIAATLGDLGWMAYDRGDYPQAEALFREALALRRERFGAEHRDVAESLADVGMALRNVGDYAGAERFLQQALAMRRRILPADHPALADNLSSLAAVHRSLGDIATAEELYREALVLMTRLRGADHVYVAIVMNNLARVLQFRGDLEGAEDLYRRALAIRRRGLGDRHPSVAMNLNDLGRLLHDAGDLGAAESLYHEALELYPPEHPWRSATVFNLGRVYEARGQYRAAERQYRQALEEQRVQYGEEHERVGIDLNQLGVVLHRQGRLSEAEASLRQALAIFRKGLPAAHFRIAEALVPLGAVLLDARRPDEAEPLLAEALEIRRTVFGEEDARTREVRQALERARAMRQP